MTIPHSRPRFGPAFTKVARRVIDSGYLLMGSEAAHLEREISTFVGQPVAAAVDSGTAALELSLRALAAGRRVERVGIPAYVCSSVLHGVRNAGCTPVLMDCGDDLCLLPDAVAQAEAMDAVVVVHPFGLVEPLAAANWPCPMIEDIAQSAGAVLDGRPVGNFGDIAVTSFHATKPWGGAYGGMVLGTAELVERVKMMRDPDHGDEQTGYAGHHQLSDLHAALAACRFTQAEAEQELRSNSFDRLMALFTDDTTGRVLHERRGNDFRFLVRVEQAGELIQHLHEQGVMAARPVQAPLSALVGHNCPGAQEAWEQMVSIPLLADMSNAELKQIQRAINSA